MKVDIGWEAATVICGEVILDELLGADKDFYGYESFLVALEWFGTTEQIARFCEYKGIGTKEFHAKVADIVGMPF